MQPIRLRILRYSVLGIFLLIAGKVLYLQVFHRTFFQHLAEQQSTRVIKLKADRGRIIDARGRVIAEDTFSYSVWTDPREVAKKEETARDISLLVGIDPQALRRKLDTSKRFVWIKRKVDYDLYRKIKEKKLGGIYVLKENRRFYPQGSVAAQVLGFVDIDNNGLEGMERAYDAYLRGQDGWSYSLRDCRGKLLPLKNQLVPARNGYDLVLNIDAQVQYQTESFLQAAIKKYRAKGGSAVVMQPSTGKVIALVNFPTFDPNGASTASADARRNRSITDFYEPGSVFKVVTLLASLNEGTFKEDDVVFCENGEYKIPGSILHDWKPYGKLTFQQVFEKSSNIGVAKIAQALKPAVLYRYIKKLRFGEITGIDVAGEVPGIVKKPQNWSKTSSYIIPIGQEVCVTNMQIAVAFSIIANGGYVVRPQVVDRVVNREGVTIKSFPAHISAEPVVPPEVIERAKKILTRVVSDGTAKLAKIDGVDIAGKTGTAQKVEPGTHHYSKSKYIVSFVGFFPSEHPEFVIAVNVDEPAFAQYGGVICAPVFRQIAEFLLKYKNIKI